MIRIFLFLLMLSLSITFYSCDSKSGLSVEDFDVVVTFYDDLAPFSTIRRYSTPDSVVVIFDSTSSSAGNVTHEYDSLILSEVEKNLEAIGYTREFVPSQNPPDVFVIISAVISDRFNAARKYDLYEYWKWYTGWTIFSGWGPGWSVRYPWQQSDITYNYSIGSLVIMMLDASLVEALPPDGLECLLTLPQRVFDTPPFVVGRVRPVGFAARARR